MNKTTEREVGGASSVIIARDFKEIESLRTFWVKIQRMYGYGVPNTDIDMYISEIIASDGKQGPWVMLLKHNGNPEAVVIGRTELHQFRCKIGYKVVYKPLMRCLTIVYGGILAKENKSICSRIIAELLSTLKSGEVDMVKLDMLKVDSSMYQLARRMPNVLCRNLPAKKAAVHWSMAIPENINQFYQTCSGKTRNTLRRKVRKFEKEFSGHMEFRTYDGPSKLDEAIRTASELSELTYQRGLGAGFTENSLTRNLMSVAANKGWFRMCILYIRGEPCAFQLGLQYQKTYFLQTLGFNPRWGRWNIGTVVFLNVLEDLCRDSSVESFDFGFGDAQYKQSYGGKQWPEASAYIFAPRLRPVMVNVISSAVSGLSLRLNQLTDRMNITRWVKRRWRDRLQGAR